MKRFFSELYKKKIILLKQIIYKKYLFYILILAFSQHIKIKLLNKSNENSLKFKIVSYKQ